MQAVLDYADAIADWFLEIGEIRSLAGNWEESLKCSYVAATILARQNRSLTCTRLEANLCFIAERLGELEGARLFERRDAGQKDVCLHVLTQALPAGGRTAMAVRWMSNDSSRIHCVALLEQEVPIPEWLVQTVNSSGGRIYKANTDDPLVKRALWLRALAGACATYVVLHVDIADVICGAAFGKSGGPPVLLVNHNAHTLWTGACIADVVINCRGSVLEEYWTEAYRGIARYATIPIPLQERPSDTSPTALSRDLRQRAKAELGILESSIVILTVGASFKYLPMNGLDFVQVYEGLLTEFPQAHLVVVGFEADSRWKVASQRTGNRIRVLGAISRSVLATVHAAADIYVEGFPFGTTTALLEAALKGVPAVLAPAQCPPPYGSDGVALDTTLDRALTMTEYRQMVVQLITEESHRIALGNKLRSVVRQHHTGIGWGSYLEKALRKAPKRHSVYPIAQPRRTPQDIHEYWLAFVPQWSNPFEETLDHALIRALSIGVRPPLTRKVLQTYRESGVVSVNGHIPWPLLVLLCNFVLRVIPIMWGCKVFRLISFVFRGSVRVRLRARVAQLFGATGMRGAYAEYYSVSDNARSLARIERSGRQ